MTKLSRAGMISAQHDCSDGEIVLGSVRDQCELYNRVGGPVPKILDMTVPMMEPSWGAQVCILSVIFQGRST
jgi:hypothetical protein